MADYRVTVTEEPVVESGGWVTFQVVIERPATPPATGWVVVPGAASQLRATVAEVRTALQDANPMQALGAVLVSYAQQDTAVIADSKVAPYRDQFPPLPVTIEFTV